MKLSDLKPAEYNPRKMSRKQLERLRKSLDEFGDLSGIIYNRRTGNLIGGHQRVKALPLHAEILCDRLAGPSRAGTVSTGVVTVEGETYSYREVDWPVEREKLANIAANKHTGEWDDEKLTEIMEELSALPDFDLDLTGFTDRELEALLDTVIEDDFDAEKEYGKIVEPRTRRGDVYQLGPHRLMCGDSRAAADAAVLMGGEKARLVFTDPPYNVDYKSPSSLSYDSKKYGGSGGKIFNDNLSDDECVKLYTEVLRNLYTHTMDDAAIYWWFASRNHHLNHAAFAAARWHMSQVIIWLKNSMIFARGQDYHRQYEPCMVGWKKGKRHYTSRHIRNYKDVFNLDFDDFVEMLDVWYERRDATTGYMHPTQKPVRLAERALKKNSEPGDVVLDLFGGSGSTLIACDQMSRRACLMELDPKYCDVIVTRYVKFTGNKQIVFNGKKKNWRI